MADQLLSVEDMSEIPNKSHSSSGGGSKGANLFLARQKAIADMMEQEEAERAAEEANHQQSHGFDHQEAADVGEGSNAWSACQSMISLYQFVWWRELWQLLKEYVIVVSFASEFQSSMVCVRAVLGSWFQSNHISMS